MSIFCELFHIHFFQGERVSDPHIGWPSCGEIDIAELTNGRRARIHGADLIYCTLHTRSSGSRGTGQFWRLPPGELYSDKFRNYWLEWTPEGVAIGVDDQTVMYQVRNI